MEISNEGSLTISTYPIHVFQINKLNIPTSQFQNFPNTTVIPRNFDKRIAHLELKQLETDNSFEVPITNKSHSFNLTPT
jgi:hypothetical protein